MRACHRFLPLLLVLGPGLAACGDDAERFFSGRPSDMSMVHNHIIGGPPEATLVLLRVPARFPQARPAHVSDWQSSLIAWWRRADKAAQMRSQFGQLTPAEREALMRWVSTRDPGLPASSAATLTEVADALRRSP